MPRLDAFELERAAAELWHLSREGKLSHKAATAAADALLDQANTEEAQGRFDANCRYLAKRLRPSDQE